MCLSLDDRCMSLCDVSSALVTLKLWHFMTTEALTGLTRLSRLNLYPCMRDT